jgi:WD40 repeat protein
VVVLLGLGVAGGIWRFSPREREEWLSLQGSDPWFATESLKMDVTVHRPADDEYVIWINGASHRVRVDPSSSAEDVSGDMTEAYFGFDVKLHGDETEIEVRLLTEDGELLDTATKRVVIDRTPPVITVEGGLELETEQRIEVRGRVEDDHPKEWVAVNDFTRNLTDGAFTIPVDLEDQAEKTLEIVAADRVGNESRAKVTVRRTTRVPEVSKRLLQSYGLGVPDRLAVSEKGLVRWTDVLGDRRLRAHGPVRGLVFTREGLRTGGSAGGFRTWSVRSGRELSREREDSALFSVRQIAVSRHGQRTAICSSRLDSWEPTGEIAWSRQLSVDGRVLLEDEVCSVSFLPDGLSVAWLTARAVGVRRVYGDAVWEHALEQDSYRLSKGASTAVVASPAGKTIHAGCTDGRILTFRAEEDVLLRTLEGHGAFVTSLAVCEKAPQLLVSGSQDSTIRVWDGSTGECRAVLKPETKSGGITAVALSPAGDSIASGDDWGVIRIWSVSRGEPLRWVQPVTGDVVHSLAWSPDGSTIASGHASGRIRLLSADTLKETIESAGHAGAVIGVASAPDGSWVASGGVDDTIRVWDLSTGAEIRRLELGEKTVGEVLGAIVASPEGDWLAGWWMMGPTVVWDTTSWDRLWTKNPGFIPEVRALRTKLVGQFPAAGPLHIHDARTGSEERTLESFGSLFTGASPDGRRLLLHRKEVVAVLDLDLERILCRREGKGRSAPGAFSEGGGRSPTCCVSTRSPRPSRSGTR